MTFKLYYSILHCILNKTKERKNILKSKIFLLLALILCIGLTSANAQTISKFAKKSQWEVGGSISFTSSTAVNNGETADNSTATLSFQPYGGYFVINGLELGVMPSVDYTKFGDYNSTSYVLYFAPSYNFDTKSQFYPYITGLIGYNAINSGNDNRKGIAWGGEAGVKMNLLGNSLLKLGIQYIQQTLNPDPNITDERNGYNTFRVNLGFNVFFY